MTLHVCTKSSHARFCQFTSPVSPFENLSAKSDRYRKFSTATFHRNAQFEWSNLPAFRNVYASREYASERKTFSASLIDHTLACYTYFPYRYGRITYVTLKKFSGRQLCNRDVREIWIFRLRVLSGLTERLSHGVQNILENVKLKKINRGNDLSLKFFY